MSYPTSPEFKAINITSKHSNLVSETVSGKVQVRALGGQKWSFTAKYNPMTRAEFMPVYAFVTALQGRYGTFTIVPTATGTVTVNGAHTAGDTTIAITGLTGTLKAGDFIKFSTHDKVYMVTADLTGSGTLSIEPGIVVNVASGSGVTYNSVPFKMRLNNDVQEYSLSANEYYEYEIDMEEVL
jgi:hypothetical protein